MILRVSGYIFTIYEHDRQDHTLSDIHLKTSERSILICREHSSLLDIYKKGVGEGSHFRRLTGVIYLFN